MLFRYGKKSGYMGIALLVLAVIPLIVAAIFVPQMADEIPMKFNAAGEVTRWGARTELFIIPVLCVLLSAATYLTAFRTARMNEESKVVAAMSFKRVVRNGIVTAVFLDVVSIYFIISAYMGVGLPI